MTFSNSLTFPCVNEDVGWLVGWLVGFYGTAALYRLYSAGECSERDNECACRLVGSYHLAPSNSG